MLIGKRILCMVLALTLLVGYMPPVHVHAEEIVVTEPAAAETAAPTEAAVTEYAAEAATEAATAPAEETAPPTQPAVPEETAAPTTPATEVPAVTEAAVSTVAEISEDAIASGTCGENLTWVLDAEGTITISGTGPMDDFADSDIVSSCAAPWGAYADDIVCAVIEDGVTYIDNHAFMNCVNLQKVTVAASVTEVGWYHSGGGAGGYNGAFFGCSNLKSVGPIGSGCDFEFGWTKTIPSGAFYGMGPLTKIIMPETITSIGYRALWGTAISEITSAGPIGSGCDYEFGWTTEIADGAFDNMYALTSVTIPETVTSIGDYAFQSCSKLQGIALPENLKTIGEWAFSSCSAVTEMVLPSGLESIGEGAFSSCKFKNIVIPEKVTAIEDSTFYGCSALESITLPSSLVSIGRSAFDGCSSLKEITLPETVTTIESFAFEGCSALTTIVIPDPVTAIESWTFSGCTTLVNIVIPASVTSIGQYAFYGCTALTDVYYKGSYGDWGKITIEQKNDVLETVTVHCAKPTGGSCGEGATWELTREGVLTISGQGDVTETPWKEYMSQITIKEIVVKDGITSLPSTAFSWYPASIEKVTIAGSVTSIGGSLFRSDSAISSAGPIGSGCDYEYGWTIEIPDEAFYYLENLTTVLFPEPGPEGGITKIGDRAFWCCKSLTDITLPDTVEEIGTQAFYKCQSLKKLTIPAKAHTLGYYMVEECEALTDLAILGSVGYLPHGMLLGCTGLQSITLPRSLYHVMEGTFASCTALTDVYYTGSQEEWENWVLIEETGNEPLLNATVHFGWNAVHLGDVRFYQAWENSTNLAFFDYNDSAGCLVTEETDQTFRDNPEALEQTYVMVETRWEGEQEILLSVKGVETRTGWVTEASPYYIAIEGTTYTTPIDLINPWQYTGCFVMYHLYEGNLVGIEVLDIQDFLDNSAIEINGPGNAYAYYQALPYHRYTYRVNDTEGWVDSDGTGLLKIPLGYFDSSPYSGVTIQITKINSVELTQPLEKTADVTVTPVTFEQEWDVSLSGAVSAALVEGGEINILNLVDAEAKVIGVEVGAGAKGSTSIKREYSGGSNTLEIIQRVDIEGNEEVSSGVTADIGKVKFTLAEIASGIDHSVGSTFGLKIEDYDQDNFDQQRTLAKFFLNLLALEHSNNVLLKSINNRYSGTDYLDESCEIIEGSTMDAAGYLKANAGGITVNKIDLFMAAGSSGEIAASFESSEKTDGEIEKSSSYKSEMKLSALTLGGDDGLNLGSLIVGNIMGRDTEVTSVSSNKEEYIEASALDEATAGSGFLILGETYDSEYYKYRIQDEVLTNLIDSNSIFRSYLSGRRNVLSADNIREIGALVDKSAVPVPYSLQNKEQAVWTLPLNLELAVIVGAGVGVELSCFGSVTYDKAIGVVKDGKIYITGESDASLEQQVENREWNIYNLLDTAFAALTADIREFFTVLDALEAEKAHIKIQEVEGEYVTTNDWSYYIMYSNPGPTGDPLPYTSYAVRAVGNSAEETAVDEGPKLDLSVSEYSDKVMTIGSPVILTVVDNATEEEITDFGETPLEFTIRYYAEELEAANLTMQSAVVLDGSIAIYRYSDNGDYYEYIGGVNDLEAMTVTAQITKPGQYILAVDSCAPSLRVLDVSDFRQTPTIKAIVDDPTGLDVSKFTFVLDGVTKVDSTNVGDYYDAAIATFTYAVPEAEALAEGAHTMSFTLADTAGNTETYKYTFNIDLTAPVITSATVTGATNASSAVEIRAEIDDANLTSVYALFSMYLSDGTWTEEVSTEMVDLGNGLWGIDYVGDGSTVTVRVCATDIGGNQTYSELVEVKPYLEAVTISRDYVALYQGQSVQLFAEALPLEFTDDVSWSVDDEAVISVDENGMVTANGVGTAYVIASVSDGETDLTARCRVDVQESVELDGIQLSTQKVTTELYSTNYAGFEILLQLPQNYPVAATTYDLRGRNTGVMMEAAYFADPVMAEMFEIVVLDDRSVLVIPTDYAVANPKLVASKYTGPVAVVVQGKEYYSENLTLTVKKTMPKLKATVAAFNSFYSFDSKEIVITGGTPTAIYADESKNTAIPYWLTLSDGVLTLTENAPLKSASGKAYVKVETEEWRIPAALTLSVKNTYKAPGLKLSASSVTLAKQTEDSNGVTLKLQCKNKKDTLESLNVLGIEAPDGYTVENFNLEDGSFILKAQEGFKSGKITLRVKFSDTDVAMPLTLTVKTAAVTTKLSAKSVTLNKAITDSAVIKVTTTPADYRLTAPTIRLTGTALENGKKVTVDKLNSGELDVRYEDGQIKITTTANTPEKASYKLYVSAGGSKEAAATINVISAVPSVTLKAKGNMDLSFPNQTATITPTFKNYSGSIVSYDYHITEMKGKTVVNEDVSQYFAVEQEGKTFTIRCTEDSINTGNTYAVKLKLFLEDGSSLENTVNLRVKRTAVKLKLSTSKLSLNKLIDDEGTVTVTCTTKGYDFDAPIWTLTDAKNNSAEGQLDISYADGKLTVGVNDSTKYGTTYKIVLKANEYGTASTLTVTVPTEAKSKITATVKVSGKLDVIRDGSAITVSPSYKNCIASTKGEPELLIYSSADKFKEPVNELFNIEPNGKGGFTVTKAEGANLSHSLKYKVKLVTTFGNTKVESAQTSMSVSMGAARLTVGADSTTLFAKDKNDRVVFWLEASDSTLNGAARVEIKDAKQREMFEILDYGDGVYAIGFKDGVVNKSINGKTVTLSLNVYMTGNQTTKPNTTVKVKVTVVK